MVQDYLGQKHVYGEVDCIELIRSFYEKELKIEFDTTNLPKIKRVDEVFYIQIMLIDGLQRVLQKYN